MRKISVLAVLLLWCWVGVIGVQAQGCPLGTDVYVDVSATGANNGYCWTDAFTSLEDALDKVNNDAGYGGVTAMHVAEGTYAVNGQPVNSRVNMYGGYSSGGGINDPETYVSLIEDDITGTVAGIDAYIIDGFKFQAPSLMTTISFDLTGAGAENIEIYRCTIEDRVECELSNFASLKTLNSYFLGPVEKILIENNGSVQFISCSFNLSQGYSWSPPVGVEVNNTQMIVSFERCIFFNCLADNLCHIDLAGSGLFRNCRFTANRCEENLISVELVPSLSLVNCLFDGNNVTEDVPMITSALASSRVNMLNCTFTGNWAFNDYGGAVYGFAGSLTTLNVENCVIWGNNWNCTDDTKGLFGYTGSFNHVLNISYSCIQDDDPDDGVVYSSPNGSVQHVNDDDPDFFTDGTWTMVSGIWVWTPGDYHLQTGSPSLLTGNANVNEALFAVDGNGNPIDLEGNPRFNDDPYAIDMGVYNIGAVDYYLITVECDKNGTISPDHNVSVPAGSDVLFTITPDSYYRVQNIYIGSDRIPPGNSYTFEDIQQNSSIKVEFTPALYPFEGLAVDNDDNSPIGDVTVAIRGDNTVAGTVSHDKYTFNAAAFPGMNLEGVLLDNLPAGQYTFTFTHDCYQTKTETFTMPLPTGPRPVVRLDKKTTPQPEAEIAGCSHELLKVREGENGPDPNIVTWVILDDCDPAAGIENVTLRGAGIADQCFPAIIIRDYEWFVDNVSVATTQNLTGHQFNTGTTYLIEFKVTDTDNNTHSDFRYLTLRPCVPDYNRPQYINVVHDWDGVPTMVGDYLFSDDGIESIKLGVTLDIFCFCRETRTPVEWTFQLELIDSDGNHLDDYGSANGTGIPAAFPKNMSAFLLEAQTGEFGYYRATFVLTLGGDEEIRIEKRFLVVFGMPLVLCPPFGCTSKYEYCDQFEYRMPLEKLDVTENYDPALQSFEQMLEFPIGKGIALEDDANGAMDLSTFKTRRTAGDFTLVARIKDAATLDASAQAGIMVREDDRMFGRMAFLGLKNGNIQLIVRDKSRKAVSPREIANTGNHDCFRIDRINGVYAFYSAPSSSDECPCVQPESSCNGWGGKIELGGHDEFELWEGSSEVGLSLAGAADVQTEFDNVRMYERDLKLTEPMTIVNTVFSEGNLVSNWNFEQPHFFFGPQTANYIPHLEAADAYSGRYICRIEDKTDNSSTLTSDPLPAVVELDGNFTDRYTFSCVYRTNASFPSGVHPTVILQPRTGSPVSVALNDYTASSAWKHYLADFDMSSGTDVVSFTLQLVDEGETWNSGHIDFDIVGIEPNFVNVASEKIMSKPVTVHTYADGFEQTFQTVKPHGDHDIVASTILDYEGRVERVLPVFTAAANLHKVKDDPIGEMRRYFTSPQVNPRNYCAGSVPIAFRPALEAFRKECGLTLFDNSPIDRPLVKIGYLSTGNENAVFGYDDVMFGYYLDQASVDADGRYHYLQTNTQIGGIHLGNVARTTTEYFNARRQVVKTVTHGPTDLVATKKYDALSNVWQATSPLGNETSSIDDDYTSTYRYNTEGKQIESTDPDAGNSRVLYDKLGNARFVRDGNMSSRDRFIAHRYDRFNRLTHVFVVNDPGGNLFTQSRADDTQWPAETASGVSLKVKNGYDRNNADVPSDIRAEQKNTVGRMHSSFAYTDKGVVRRYYSYDYSGNVSKEWVAIPGLPRHTIDYTYNIGKQLVEKVTNGKVPKPDGSEGDVVTKKETYRYDELNRIKYVYSEDIKVGEYVYYPDGKVMYKDFGEEVTPGDPLPQSIAFRYDPRGALEMQRQELRSGTCYLHGNSQFYQKLTYDDFGNISVNEYRIPDQPENKRFFNYTYDHFHRLTAADFGTDSNPGSSELDGLYEYDRDGALTSLYRGTLTQNPANAPVYSYLTGTHRLTGVDKPVIAGGKDRSAADNYLYDANGNIIEDKSTARRIEYDYRNMPVKITQFTDNTFASEKQVTEFIYDASGTRVAKTRREVQ